MLPKTLTFVDIETTGGSLTHDRIIEIGILRMENNRIVKKYQSLLDPQTHVSPFILEMTGIDPTKLESAPTFHQIKDEVYELLKESVFVAHNVRFDYGFIKQAFKSHEIEFSPKQMCTVKLFRALYPTLAHHNLDSLIAYFDFKCKRRHRAFDDAKVLYDFYKKIQKKFDTDVLEKALSTASKRPAIPVGIPVEMMDTLPETPGVYIFYGESGAALYIGKSINIKERVLSHFSQNHVSTTEMKIAQQIKSIDTHQTVGELGALFLESKLIKELQPIYNRKLRIKKELVVAKKSYDKEGYVRLLIERCATIDPHETEMVVGIYKSYTQAKDDIVRVAKEHALCPKLCAVEKSTGYCFSYQLGWCHGACKQEEKALSYNMRFEEAFTKTSLKKWPFEGPILIKETNPDAVREAFLIDKWCLLGSCTWDDYESSDMTNRTYQFDIDTYKILHTFIQNPKNHKHIHTVPTFSEQTDDSYTQEYISI